jgi:hypothetical protein
MLLKGTFAKADNVIQSQAGYFYFSCKPFNPHNNRRASCGLSYTTQLTTAFAVKLFRQLENHLRVDLRHEQPKFKIKWA